MYIKNISQLFKDQLPLKFRINEGNTVYGKIISQEGKSGVIKLYDGTIIPSIFISENQLPKDKYIKFIVEEFNEEEVVLRILDEEPGIKENSFSSITKRLNIPDKEGKEIVMNLIKFNLPVNDENILGIYKNISFFSKIRNMNDEDILSFLSKYLGRVFTPEDSEFKTAQNIFSILSNVDIDFLSFLIENDVPGNLSNILNMEGFLKNGFEVNTIMDKLHEILNIEYDSDSTFSLKDLLDQVKESPETFKEIPFNSLNRFINNIDILKALYDNYDIYFFNTYSQGNLFKNNIIIKNKYKSSKYIDPDNAKVFITVETPFTGIVEAYLYKKSSSITISIKTSEKFISLFKEKLPTLKENLCMKGYEVVKLSVEKLLDKANIVTLGDFFSDSIFKELDVKV